MRFKTHYTFYGFVQVFVDKAAFDSGLLFSRNAILFRACHVSFVFAQPYYQQVRIDRGIMLVFGTNSTS